MGVRGRGEEKEWGGEGDERPGVKCRGDWLERGREKVMECDGM